MWQFSRFTTVDMLSRVFILWAYLFALLALWGRIEVVAGAVRRAQETADMGVDMAQELYGGMVGGR